MSSRPASASLSPDKTGRLAILACVAALCLLLAVMAGVTMVLRGSLRAQILGRDAAILGSVAVYEAERTEALELKYTGSSSGAADRVLTALLDVSRLDGVVALRVFDEEGAFMDAVPATFVRGGIEEGDLATLRNLRPVSRFHPKARLDSFLVSDAKTASEAVPLLEVIVPVYTRGDRRLLGIGQFLLDGAPTAKAFAELDKNLLSQAGAAFAAAILLGGGLIGWSLWKLRSESRRLMLRTRELARANRALALRSRVSAIGAVTANLLHGLKNPLAALSLFVEERRRGAGADGDDAGEASAAVRRMGRMIEESVSILAQEEGGERFDFALSEVAAVVKDRTKARAAERGVTLVEAPSPQASLDNRCGNLLTLAAVNLVTNAVEASPKDSTVRLFWEADAVAGRGIFRVEDSGCGLPEAMRADPFRPVKSAKEGGSGVGLAIAAQLAGQMGGEIRLESSGETGTVFSIRFPVRA